VFHQDINEFKEKNTILQLIICDDLRRGSMLISGNNDRNRIGYTVTSKGEESRGPSLCVPGPMCPGLYVSVQVLYVRPYKKVISFQGSICPGFFVSHYLALSPS
jgi:hypothetical protein